MGGAASSRAAPGPGPAPQPADPRSPTPDVARTPLRNSTNPKHNITKNADLRKTFESGNADDKRINNNPILSAVIKSHLQSYDPRSPTQDFDRTPVVLEDKNVLRAKAAQHDSLCLENDHDPHDLSYVDEELNTEFVPKNLCEGFFNMTMDGTSFKEPDEPLGSSTASQDAIEKNTSVGISTTPPKKLLETNFDYVETIEVKQQSQDINKKETIVLSAFRNNFEILESDPRSPSVGIDRTPIVVMKSEKNHSSESLQESVEEMSDDCLIKALQGTNMELRQTLVKANEKNNQALLIYEDDSSKNVNVTPVKSKSASNSGSRTPLSCMKNKTEGHARSKSVNTLSDPSKKIIPSKIPKRISNIPRLQGLQSKLAPVQSAISLKISKMAHATSQSSVSLKSSKGCQPVSGDCENTPPPSHRAVWDKDSSIVL